jgi:hypothetical protein
VRFSNLEISERGKIDKSKNKKQNLSIFFYDLMFLIFIIFNLIKGLKIKSFTFFIFNIVTIITFTYSFSKIR